MAYKEAPHVDEAITEFLFRYGSEIWFFDAAQFTDDAGARLLVKVLDPYYIVDVLPRKIKDCFVVVQRVPVPLTLV